MTPASRRRSRCRRCPAGAADGRVADLGGAGIVFHDSTRTVGSGRRAVTLRRPSWRLSSDEFVSSAKGRQRKSSAARPTLLQGRPSADGSVPQPAARGAHLVVRSPVRGALVAVLQRLRVATKASFAYDRWGPSKGGADCRTCARTHSTYIRSQFHSMDRHSGRGGAPCRPTDRAECCDSPTAPLTAFATPSPADPPPGASPPEALVGDGRFWDHRRGVGGRPSSSSPRGS